MSVFKEYSHYYNLLYEDKNYVEETAYIDRLIEKFSLTKSHTVLNLGCGTGKHDNLLAQKGYEMTGVDFSNDMLEIARANYPQIDFFEGDIRTLKLNKTFDVVLSLFHVISYQTLNKDIYDAFLTAKHHLRVGGIFIFDFWYGPSVIAEMPSKRTKEVEDDKLRIVRYTTPIIHPNENKVDVHFAIEITNKQNNEITKLKELHQMRYLFLPELRQLLNTVGFMIQTEEEWMTGGELGFHSWSGCIVARR
jgi:SAM-dependent methyltransferase